MKRLQLFRVFWSRFNLPLFTRGFGSPRKKCPDVQQQSSV